MHWSMSAAVIAIVACGLVVGCGLRGTEIAGDTPQDKLHFLAKRHPDLAFGLGYAKGGAPAEILVAGMTEKRGTIPVTEGARWHIGSISKSFTSTLILRLVERGKLDLDAPIDGYLTRYSAQMHPEWRAVTLRQLLSHTSGAQPNIDLDKLEATMGLDPYAGRREVLADVWREPLAGQPGAYEYSNVGYVVAGVIAEEVSGAPWEDLIRREIASPLGLTSLGFGAPKGEGDPRGHVRFLGHSRAIDPNSLDADNPAWMGPAGAIHLSLGDLVAWGQAHLRACRGELPEFLSAESCQTQQRPVREDYALGWVVDRQAPHGPAIWHNGSNLRWYAILYLDPARDMSTAVVTNSAQGDGADALVRSVANGL